MLLTVELRNLSALELAQLRENTRRPGTKIVVQAVLEDMDTFEGQASLIAGAGFLRVLDEDTTQRMSLRACPGFRCDSSLGPDTSSHGSSSPSLAPTPSIDQPISAKDAHGVAIRMRQPPPPPEGAV